MSQPESFGLATPSTVTVVVTSSLPIETGYTPYINSYSQFPNNLQKVAIHSTVTVVVTSNLTTESGYPLYSY
ncbi:hypothetical protein RRG08_056906 [Elysia crispata]|uniref:Uncharacterized protein n=1 Tax=Elysia crispata TaxID=231223 RepID=A0AAE0Y8I9_9GAST|nr:hypothetical protein RRG08_056906 [Elysia crispata]